jgi:hypothetical protein
LPQGKLLVDAIINNILKNYFVTLMGFEPTLCACNRPAVNALPYSTNFSVLLQIVSIQTIGLNGLIGHSTVTINFYRSTSFYAKGK